MKPASVTTIKQHHMENLQIQFKPFYEHKKCTVLYSFYFSIWYKRYWIFNAAYVVAGYLIAQCYDNPVPQVNQPNKPIFIKDKEQIKIIFIIQ